MDRVVAIWLDPINGVTTSRYTWWCEPPTLPGTTSAISLSVTASEFSDLGHVTRSVNEGALRHSLAHSSGDIDGHLSQFETLASRARSVAGRALGGFFKKLQNLLRLSLIFQFSRGNNSQPLDLRLNEACRSEKCEVRLLPVSNTCFIKS
jgi:hypothetical protein